jgi:hypothetical protein
MDVARVAIWLVACRLPLAMKGNDVDGTTNEGSIALGCDMFLTNEISPNHFENRYDKISSTEPKPETNNLSKTSIKFSSCSCRLQVAVVFVIQRSFVNVTYRYILSES